MTPTRRIVAFNRVTADGYFATPDGNLDWVVPDSEVDKLGGEATPGPDNTLLFGRRTYDMFEKFWPHVVKDSPTAPDPHNAGRHTAEMRAMGVWINEATKVVFSRTRKDVTWKNSRLVHEFDASVVEELKKQPGRDIMVFGSGSITAQLTERGLVDEYTFVVSPVLLGNGKNLLTGLGSRVKLDLVESKQFPSGTVLLRYARPPA